MKKDRWAARGFKPMADWAHISLEAVFPETHPTWVAHHSPREDGQENEYHLEPGKRPAGTGVESQYLISGGGVRQGQLHRRNRDSGRLPHAGHLVVRPHLLPLQAAALEGAA